LQIFIVFAYILCIVREWLDRGDLRYYCLFGAAIFYFTVDGSSHDNIYIFDYYTMNIVAEFQTACDKVIEHLETAFKHLQLWRASTGLVEEIHVHVTSRGMDQKLNQVANIGIMDPQTLKIEPWDKATLPDIEKAVYDADIWLTPQNQWDYLLIKVPPLTTERRKDLTKVVARDGEDAKIAVRNKRQDARKHAEVQFKSEDISENTRHSIENQVDEISSKINDQIDQMVKNKGEEVMKV